MLRVVKTLDILPHHTRFCHPRTDDGTRCHEGLIVVATQLSQQASHGRTLDVKTAVSLGISKQILDFFVFFKILNTMNVDAHASVFLYHLHRVFDMPYSSLTEDVEFLNPQTLSDIHVPLRRREAFRRHVEGRETCYRVFGYQHAAGMDRTDVREVEDVLREVEDRAHNGVLVGVTFRTTAEVVELVLRQAMNLSQLA